MMPSNTKKENRGFSFLVFASIFGSLGLGLMLVWLNIERVDLAYEVRTHQTELDKKNQYITKLNVERDNLMAPARLRELARDLDLGPAQPGQIRRIKAE